MTIFERKSNTVRIVLHCPVQKNSVCGAATFLGGTEFGSIRADSGQITVGWLRLRNTNKYYNR